MKDFEVCPVGTMESVHQLTEEKNELYDALQESREVINCLVGDGYLGYIPLRTQIDNVLKKAGGEL